MAQEDQEEEDEDTEEEEDALVYVTSIDDFRRALEIHANNAGRNAAKERVKLIYQLTVHAHGESCTVGQAVAAWNKHKRTSTKSMQSKIKSLCREQCAPPSKRGQRKQPPAMSRKKRSRQTRDDQGESADAHGSPAPSANSESSDEEDSPVVTKRLRGDTVSTSDNHETRDRAEPDSHNIDMDHGEDTFDNTGPQFPEPGGDPGQGGHAPAPVCQAEENENIDETLEAPPGDITYFDPITRTEFTPNAAGYSEMNDEERNAYRRLRDEPCSLAVALGLAPGSDFIADEPRPAEIPMPAIPLSNQNEDRIETDHDDPVTTADHQDNENDNGVLFGPGDGMFDTANGDVEGGGAEAGAEADAEAGAEADVTGTGGARTCAQAINPPGCAVQWIMGDDPGTIKANAQMLKVLLPEYRKSRPGPDRTALASAILRYGGPNFLQ